MKKDHEDGPLKVSHTKEFFKVLSVASLVLIVLIILVSKGLILSPSEYRLVVSEKKYFYSYMFSKTSGGYGVGNGVCTIKGQKVEEGMFKVEAELEEDPGTESVTIINWKELN